MLLHGETSGGDDEVSLHLLPGLHLNPGLCERLDMSSHHGRLALPDGEMNGVIKDLCT